ncbi:MAG: molybdopterin-synthase adenylyltransferase MoeB [Gammaproteobacteria bacterium]|nr:molybdopterin-synthase adenylyltransferase MoeB [Gammaproteobacteria bacterium]MDH3560128.1 molybdopterin-synthase adenylyltransferase MoeB [Gammaproteobacteria bacterium]
MNDDQLLRYSRQILLPQVGIAGQEKLLATRALIVGAGGLGSPAAIYLAAAGVGHLVIADDDRVELSNLQRQILHHESDIGRDKVASAMDTLAAINPEVQVTPIAERLQGGRLEQAVSAADLVLDCSDNFATRFAVNQACVTHRTPLVSGAAVRLEGQVAVFIPGREDSPCYSCLYREGEDEDQTCSENGVLSPLVGIIGSLQALEAVKVALSLGQDLCGRLVVFDAYRHEWRTLKVPRDPGCPVCGQQK